MHQNPDVREVRMKKPVFEGATSVWTAGLQRPSHLCVDDVAFTLLCLPFIYRLA